MQAFPYLKFTARRGKKKSSAYHGSVVFELHCASESPGGLLKHSMGPQLECSSLFHIFFLYPLNSWPYNLCDAFSISLPSSSLHLPPHHHHHHPHTLSACYGAFHWIITGGKKKSMMWVPLFFLYNIGVETGAQIGAETWPSQMTRKQWSQDSVPGLRTPANINSSRWN